ncbi:MAG: 5-formyltetrahydrofolate cyclo-ligase [Chloroflexi bacterium]|nr:MAG: 5-formyltetrahydrofolate cyclo-ligase [Chloroflexota bacterium]
MDKAAVRERMWRLLEREHAARFPGAHGRIPNFVGAERAAALLSDQPEWEAARALKVNPDAPQLPVRAQALAEGRRVYMAVPRLRAVRPFLRLDPARLRVTPRMAASISGASRYGRATSIEELEHIDLIICGTVAINRRGVRVGKGGGYSDLEFALLLDAGLVDASTVIATTVHDLQVLDEDLPETAHDFRVDLIVTPTRVLRPRRTKRPRGIIWGDLDGAKIEEIPVLSGRAAAAGHPRTDGATRPSRRRR